MMDARLGMHCIDQKNNMMKYRQVLMCTLTVLLITIITNYPTGGDFKPGEALVEHRLSDH
jgi:hypothetical protein